MDGDHSIEWGKLSKLVGISVGLLVLIVLSFLDSRKAYKKKEHWVPGKALVLSALTIQLITLLNGQTASLRDNDFSSFQSSPDGIPITTEERELLVDSLKNDLLMIRIGRVMICVFVAYLLPGMARAASKSYRTRLVALLLTITFQSVSEIYAISRRKSAEESISVLYEGDKAGGSSSFTLSTTTVLGSIVLLLLFLSSATLGSKSIFDVVTQKIPVVLSDPDGDYESWENVEDHVLQSWVAARVCNPEYVIARSALVAAAGLIVTVCVVASVAGWAMEGAASRFRSRSDWLKFTTVGLQCLFILIGWAIVCWRWVTAVVFYGRRPSLSGGWRSRGLAVEDFWTRHIEDQVDPDETKLVVGGGSKKKKFSTFKSARKRIWLPRELLPAMMLLQTVVLLFSKGCWFVSEIAFCNPYFMRKFILNRWKGVTSDPDYYRLQKLLDRICMPGEKPDGMWVANRAAVQQAKDLIAQGAANGKACAALVAFVRGKRSDGHLGERCLAPGGDGGDGLKYLCRVHQGEPLRAEEHFLFAAKRSWKMTAVNLLVILVRLSALSSSSSYSPRRSKEVTEAVEAYSQAWELMDLVDESDPEVHILSKAADKVFRNLQTDIKFRYSWDPPLQSSNSVEDLVQRLTKEAKLKADSEMLGCDSMDWKEVAAANSLYKLCKSMDFKAGGDVREVMEEVQASLVDVIYCCMDRVADSLVGSCRHWARRFQEKRVWKSLYIVGKARAVMEELGSKPRKHRRSTLSSYRSRGSSLRDRNEDELSDSIV